jgi:hypothetical protein
MSERNGDEVWVISGCHFPMVIRQLNHTGSLHGTREIACLWSYARREAVMKDSDWRDILSE